MLNEINIALYVPFNGMAFWLCVENLKKNCVVLISLMTKTSLIIKRKKKKRVKKFETWNLSKPVQLNNSAYCLSYILALWNSCPEKTFDTKWMWQSYEWSLFYSCQVKQWKRNYERKDTGAWSNLKRYSSAKLQE